MRRNVLLSCGILSSLVYVWMDIHAAASYEGYSPVSQTVSELSAIGAPTRAMWVWAGLIYALLVVAFGIGVRAAAGENRALRAVGSLLIADGVISPFWPPMHARGAGFTSTDMAHIVFAIVTVLLMTLAIGVSATALGRRFRVYSIATLVALLAFGAWTGVDSPRIAANLSTPWVGVRERIDIAMFLIWIVALAIALLRNSKHAIV